jgi:hypothetical protein
MRSSPTLLRQVGILEVEEAVILYHLFENPSEDVRRSQSY